MNRIKLSIATALIAISLSVAGFANSTEQLLTKEKAIEMALQAHPGEAIKAYQETKRGEAVWEVEIAGADGKQWEVYYKMSGELLKEEAE
jgi:uncharacterized membrane protein YkoI